jgi:hypothetical protein
MNSTPLLRPLPIFAVALALSIGWGIRGNFGHEYGAMIPGALAAIAACLLSGRADWWRRVAFFGMFGALGWGFGGSISYMQVIAYTHSGHAPSQYYGFACLWLIGFLWGALGGAGTALPAVMDRGRLTNLLTPLAWVFAAWLIWAVVLLPAIENWESSFDQTWQRQSSPFYWFDADWLEALIALLALTLYDLWDRRKRALPAWLPVATTFGTLLTVLALGRGGLWSSAAAVAAFALLLLIAGAPLRSFLGYLLMGGLLGGALHGICALTGLDGLIQQVFVHHQGDPENLRRIAAEQGVDYATIQNATLINWPQFFHGHPEHFGWMAGALLGGALYLRRHARFSRDASLLVALAGGWLLAFILLPTLLDLHMTPPRGDGWAGIVGVLLGGFWWLRRNQFTPVIVAALITGAVGGLGFSVAAWIKMLVTLPGNAHVFTDPEVIAFWAHYQNSNWHSFLEQTYGFINGIGIALALGWLARVKSPVSDTPRINPRADAWSAAFVLFVVVFLNAQKNPLSWLEQEVFASTLTAPLLAFIQLPAPVWFNLLFVVIALTGTGLMLRHTRQPLELLPESRLGKGQLLFLVLLWSVCVMNFERALPGFAGGRLLTEGVIFLNACLATVLVVTLPSSKAVSSCVSPRFDYEAPLWRARVLVVATLLFAGSVFPYTIRCVYGPDPAGHATVMKRFGPDATWKVQPILKGRKHL